MDTLKKKNESKYLFFDSKDKNKKVLKNTQNFEMELKMKLKQSRVVEKVNMVKMLWNLNLIQTIICH